MKWMAVLIFATLLATSALAVVGDIENRYAAPSSCPTGLATDGTYLYLADRKSNMIYKLDHETGKQVMAFEAPCYDPLGIAFDGANFWIIDSENGAIIEFDPGKRVNARTIWCPVTEPTGLIWDGTYLWVADLRSNQLLQISSDDGTIIRAIPAPSRNTTGLAFDGTYLWVADRVADRIYMVWPETGEVVIMFKAPGKYAWGLACLDEMLYCADYQADSIYALVTDDDECESTSDSVFERIEYTHRFTNHGPGKVINLDIYLALPQESARQRLLEAPTYSSPAGPELITDQWGQQVARFHFDEVLPGQVAQASFTAVVELFDHWWYIRPERVGPMEEIPKDLKRDYLKDDTKFGLSSEIIQNAVKEAVGNEKNAYWIMRKIFRYVIDNLYYERVGGWNIAPTVITRGNGSCSEYSFVFIAMSRAAGLPARFAGSIVQRGDLASEDRVFHRWVEVYLPRIGWVPIDPSGGDQELPESQAAFIGHVSNRYLVTTSSGGYSDHLGWDYNSYETWQSTGICKTYSGRVGEWSPAEASKYSDAGP